MGMDFYGQLFCSVETQSSLPGILDLVCHYVCEEHVFFIQMTCVTYVLTTSEQ